MGDTSSSIKAVIKSKQYQEESEYRGESRAPKMVSHVGNIVSTTSLGGADFIEEAEQFPKIQRGKMLKRSDISFIITKTITRLTCDQNTMVT